MRLLALPTAQNGVLPLTPMVWKPGGQRGDAVAVRHPHVERLALGEAVEDALGLLDDDAGVRRTRARSARSTLPPSRCAMSCRP